MQDTSPGTPDVLAHFDDAGCVVTGNAPSSYVIDAYGVPVYPLTVWSGARDVVKGWDGGEVAVPLHPGVPADIALYGHWRHDAHTVGYVIPTVVERDGAAVEDDDLVDEPTESVTREVREVASLAAIGLMEPEFATPRVNKIALPILAAMGQEPVMVWCFIDVDNAKHAKWPSWEAARESITRTVATLPDAFRDCLGWYATAGGWRMVFRPSRPIPVRAYAAWCAALIHKLSVAIPIADPKTGAGGIDASSNQWTRCFRLPSVTRADHGGLDTRSAPRDLDGCLSRTLAWSPKGKVAVEDLPPIPAGATFGSMDAPPMPEAETVPAETWAKLLSPKRAWAANAYSGLPLFKAGQRDVETMRAIGTILTLFETDDPTLPWNILARGVAADTTEGAVTLAKLWDRCQHFAKQHSAVLAVKKQASTEQEQAHATNAQAPALLYMAKADLFYVRNENTGSYIGPTKATGVFQHIAEHCPNAGIVYRTEKGGFITTTQLAHDWGKPIYNVVHVAGLYGTIYKPDESRLYVGHGAVVSAPAVYHEDVMHWLTLFGGSQAELFLDWLAVIHRVQPAEEWLGGGQPAGAFYAQGPKSAGKSMLAQALATMFGAENLTLLSRALSPRFNAELLSCPILYVDEAFTPPTRLWHQHFKSLVANGSWTLEAKFEQTAAYRGYPRVLITANDEKAFPIEGAMSHADVEAIVGRLTHAHIDPECPNYLQSLEGFAGTREWVTRADGSPGKIIETIEWLRENRRVQPSEDGRFAVRSVRSEYHDALESAQGSRSDILAALARAAARGVKMDGLARSPRYTYINGETLRGLWPQLVDAKVDVPKPTRLLQELRSLSDGDPEQMRFGKKNMRVWRILNTSIETTARMFHIGDVDAIGEQIRGTATTAMGAQATPNAPANAKGT